MGYWCIFWLVIGYAAASNGQQMLIPCMNIYNTTVDNIGVTWDANWDDQVLTYGKNDDPHAQKHMRKMYLLPSSKQITICNQGAFDFDVANQFMTGIIVGSADEINHDGIALTLGITSPIANLSVTDAYSYSVRYTFTESAGISRRTSNLYVINIPAL